MQTQHNLHTIVATMVAAQLNWGVYAQQSAARDWNGMSASDLSTYERQAATRGRPYNARLVQRSNAH